MTIDMYENSNQIDTSTLYLYKYMITLLNTINSQSQSQVDHPRSLLHL